MVVQAADPATSGPIPQAAPAAATELEQRTAERPAWLLPTIVGGAAAVVLIVGVGAFAAYHALQDETLPAGEDVAQTSAAAGADDHESEPAESPDGSSGSGEVAVNGGAVDPKVDPAEQAGQGSLGQDPRLAAVASITKWKAAAKNKFGGTSKIKVGVDAAWLGEELRRDAASPRPVTDDEPPQPKYAFVRLVVMNQDAEAMEYVSWNGGVAGEPAAEAILVDDQDRPAELVPYQEQLLPGRVRRQTIPPRDRLSDLLVFKLAGDEVERLRLAIPFQTGDVVRYYGLEIGPEMLAAAQAVTDGSVATADETAPGDDAAPGGDAEDPDQESESEGDAVDDFNAPAENSAPPKFEPQNGGQPDDIGELFRSIEAETEKK